MVFASHVLSKCSIQPLLSTTHAYCHNEASRSLRLLSRVVSPPLSIPPPLPYSHDIHTHTHTHKHTHTHTHTYIASTHAISAVLPSLSLSAFSPHSPIQGSTETQVCLSLSLSLLATFFFVLSVLHDTGHIGPPA